MTAPVRVLFRGALTRYAFVAALALVVLGVGAVFVADAGDQDPNPVAFSETTSIGLTAEERTARDKGDIEMPQAQVFYSQYRYVVGYHGVERAISQIQEPTHVRQFGYPMTVFVSSYDGTGVTVTGDGLLEVKGATEWIDARDAHFVVESDARSAGGETVVPFDTREEAEQFQSKHGGTIYDWKQLQDYEFDIEDAAVVRERVGDLHRLGDERLENVQSRAGGEEIVVEQTGSIQDAIDEADAGTTIVIEEGTYEEQIEIARPVTVRGENATIVGDGNGTVISVTASDVSISGIHITGVGETLRGEPLDADDDDDWDTRIQSGYGTGDAGIGVQSGANVSVQNVSIETPANGLLLRSSPDAVVRNVTVHGSDEWGDGFMGVMAMESPALVENSTFVGGRDGIYLHRSHETVIRDNLFRENRFGVHFMYTSDSLVADNVAIEQEHAGITIMTSPTRNAVVGNWAHNTTTGILPGGSHSYIADNVVTDSDRGITTGASQSVYERNLLYGNGLGMQSASIRPSNQVFESDFYGNDVHAKAGIGPLRLWTDDGIGNYWSGVAAPDGGALERSYSPTGIIDSKRDTRSGTTTLAESPAMRTLSAVQDQSPGLRQGHIVDTAPRDEPYHAELLEVLERDDWRFTDGIVALSKENDQPTRTNNISR